jgi:hypothetical protein
MESEEYSNAQLYDGKTLFGNRLMLSGTRFAYDKVRRVLFDWNKRKERW